VTESSKNNKKISRLGQRHILYDAALIEHPDEQLFHPVSDQIDNSITATGRAEAVFYRHSGLDLVLKHYHRGGLVARFMGDRYFGNKPENSRSFREWDLLQQMQAMDLPVPVPVIASIIQSGPFYRADLVTQRIKGEPMADLLMHDVLEAETWLVVGRCIKKFHRQNVYHADLNARNILVGEDNKIHLIDFDKGCFRYMGDTWKLSNIARLKRSLLKFQKNTSVFNFREQDWKFLLKGYGGRN